MVTSVIVKSRRAWKRLARAGHAAVGYRYLSASPSARHALLLTVAAQARANILHAVTDLARGAPPTRDSPDLAVLTAVHDILTNGWTTAQTRTRLDAAKPHLTPKAKVDWITTLHHRATREHNHHTALTTLANWIATCVPRPSTQKM
jgi:hypothetical protein